MAAVDDCITAVMTSPTATRTNTRSKLDHHATPGPASTAGRSAGCSRSASPPIPCCRVVSPNRTSPNPANAPPAADTRPPPSSLSNAPKKIIGNAAAVMPSRNSPTPPIIEIVVDIYPLTNQTGVHCSAASTRSQERKGIPLAGLHIGTIELTTLHHRGLMRVPNLHHMREIVGREEVVIE